MKERKLSYTQLQKQLNTWKKRDFATYNKIMMLADASGILTKTGKLSRNKKLSNQLARFTTRYKNEYGSYSSYRKNLSKRRQKSVDYRKKELQAKGLSEKEINKQIRQDLGTTLKEYEEKMQTLKDKVEDIKERYYQLGKNDDFKNIMDFAKTKTSEDAHRYLDEIYKGDIT